MYIDTIIKNVRKNSKKCEANTLVPYCVIALLPYLLKTAAHRDPVRQWPDRTLPFDEDLGHGTWDLQEQSRFRTSDSIGQPCQCGQSR